MTAITHFIQDTPAHIYVPKRKPWGRALVVSGLLHVIVVLVIIFAHPHVIETRETVLKPTIKAQLYFPLVKAPTKVEAPEPTIDYAPETPPVSAPSTPLAVDKTPAEVTDTLPTHIEIESAPASQEKAVEPSKTLPLNEAKKPASADTKTQYADQSPKPSISTQNQQAGKLNLSPRAGALDYLSSQNEQAIEEESRLAAKEFREKKNSPDIVDSRKGEEDRSYYERPIKRVNCSSTVNKSLAIIATFTGGTLECTDTGDHDKFIEARINKEKVN